MAKLVAFVDRAAAPRSQLLQGVLLLGHPRGRAVVAPPVGGHRGRQHVDTADRLPKLPLTGTDLRVEVADERVELGDTGRVRGGPRRTVRRDLVQARPSDGTIRASPAQQADGRQARHPGERRPIRPLSPCAHLVALKGLRRVPQEEAGVRMLQRRRQQEGVESPVIEHLHGGVAVLGRGPQRRPRHVVLDGHGEEHLPGREPQHRLMPAHEPQDVEARGQVAHVRHVSPRLPLHPRPRPSSWLVAVNLSRPVGEPGAVTTTTASPHVHVRRGSGS